MSIKTDFRLQHICGTVYSQGNLHYTADGKALLAPVGNRISKHDLVSGVCTTYAWGCANNISCFDVSCDGNMVLCVDEKGFGQYANIYADVALEAVTFRRGVTCVKFNNAGTRVAVGSCGEVQVWSTPAGGVLRYRSVRMLTRYRDVIQGDVTSLTWSSDDSHVMASGSDSTVRILPETRVWDFTTNINMYATLSSQKTGVVGVYFTRPDSEGILSISADRCVARWKLGTVLRKEANKLRRKAQQGEDLELEEDGETENGDKKNDEEDDAFDTADEEVPLEKMRLSAYMWDPAGKEYVTSQSRVTSSSYSMAKHILVCGMMDGTFVVSSTEPTITALHTLSISAQQISSVCVNPSGDWIAFGSARLHQLLVWEWKSETYVMRHQSHYSDINAACYSSDGSLMVSVGEDSKVKVWKTTTGQCIATFKDHQGSVIACVPNQANAVYTASADGTIRAYDLQRLKAFRVMTPPRMTQLASLALDPSGDLIASGALDTGSIYLFSTQTGKYLDEFTGHTATAVSLSFHPQGTYLASVSWDQTLRIYDIFGVDDSSGERIRGSVEALGMGSEGVCVRFSPNGRHLATLTYNSDVTIYDIQKGDVRVVCSWNVERDTTGGWMAQGPNPKATNSKRPFTTMSFSPDGATLLVGGESKWICLYNVGGGFLLKKWSVTDNRSVDGNFEVFDWRNKDSDATNIDDESDNEEDRHRKLIKLPGTAKGVHAVGKRSTRVVARTKSVCFAPGGREWCAATSCGVSVYSLDAHGVHTLSFVPQHLTRNMTPKEVLLQMRRGMFAEALVCALQLSLPDLVDRVLRAAGTEQIEGMTAAVPAPLVQGLLEAVARMVSTGRAWEVAATWSYSVLYHHGYYLRTCEDPSVAPSLKLLLKAHVSHGDVVRMVDDNTNTLRYLTSIQ
eukprot:PhM_4_TR11323/c0_g1_i1/m.51712/K14558/PWP2, UTP1; periodic tryptophan protein 2